MGQRALDLFFEDSPGFGTDGQCPEWRAPGHQRVPHYHQPYQVDTRTGPGRLKHTTQAPSETHSIPAAEICFLTDHLQLQKWFLNETFEQGSC